MVSAAVHDRVRVAGRVGHVVTHRGLDTSARQVEDPRREVAV